MPIHPKGHKEMDDLRPPGTLEMECKECGWFFWVGATDSRLPDGPWVCPPCEGTDTSHKNLDEVLKIGVRMIVEEPLL